MRQFLTRKLVSLLRCTKRCTASSASPQLCDGRVIDQKVRAIGAMRVDVRHAGHFQTSSNAAMRSALPQYRIWPVQPRDRFRLTASPHIESALTEQNEINETPAKSRGDRPNRRIKAVVGRLNMH